MSNFPDRLAAAVRERGNPVLAGLDPRFDSLPDTLTDGVQEGDLEAVADAFRAFCQGVIDAVSPLVAAVKPQAAFFEQLGPAGMTVLHDVIRYARQHGLIVILDGKRNDIGSTAEAYADAYLGPNSPWAADALTVSPYLGEDSLSPFVRIVRERDSGVFVLVKTSNPGGGKFQDLIANDEPVYRHAAKLVEQLSAESLGKTAYGDVGAVVGATYPEQLAELRTEMPHCWFLVPGFGAQGGSARDVAGAFDEDGLGAIVNSSRAIIFAHSRDEYRDRFGAARWKEAVEAATIDMIAQLRAETRAGKL